MKEYRNALKELFIKYTLHKCIRLNSLNNLLDEINDYYVKIINIKKQKNVEAKIMISKQFHDKHLKEQLNGWIKYLDSKANKLVGDSERDKGILIGYTEVIQLLKDTNKK